MKIFIDTNVWLRLLLADDEKSFKNCYSLFQQIEVGKIRPYTSSLVLLEINFVLVSFYKISQEEVFFDLQAILETRNLTLVEKTDLKKALILSRDLRIKLSNCLIKYQVPNGAFLVSYDKEFKKIKDLPVFTPDELLNKIKNE